MKEVILALNATVDGQTTAHYITELLHDADVKVTRLAHGVPVGGELDYLDEGTLSAAIKQRTLFSGYNARALRPQPLEMSVPLQPGHSSKLGKAGERADHEKPDPAGRSAIKPAPDDKYVRPTAANAVSRAYCVAVCSGFWHSADR